MNFKKTALAVMALGIGFSPLANAAPDADRIAQLEAQMKLLQEQLAALKASTVNAKQEVTDLKDQVAAQGKEAVVLGDIPGSSRIPNSDTSIRV